MKPLHRGGPSSGGFSINIVMTSKAGRSRITASLAAFGGLLGLFAATDAAVVKSANDSQVSRRLITHQYRLMKAVEAHVDAEVRAESAQRAYLLTNNSAYLGSYETSVRAARSAFGAQASTRPEERLISDLQALIERRLTSLDSAVALQRTGKHADALRLTSDGSVLSLEAAIEAVAKRLNSELLIGISLRSARYDRSVDMLKKTLAAALLSAMLLIAVTLFLIWSEIRWRNSVEEELRENEASLAQRVSERSSALVFQAEALAAEVAVRKDTETRLLSTEHRLNDALSFSRVVAWTWNPAAESVIWSGPVEFVFGVPIASYAALRAIIHPDDQELVDSKVATSISTGADYAAEFRIIRPDGEIRWIAGRGGLCTKAADGSSQMSGVNFDITDEKNIAEQLEQRERRIQQLANLLPQMIWTADPDGEFEYCNDRWYEFSGLPHSVPAKEVRKLIMHPEDHVRWMSIWEQSLRTASAYETEYRFWDSAAGGYRWYLGRAVPILASDGGVDRWFGTCTNIHRQRNAKELLEEEVRRRTAELQTSLSEKTTLLRELHHRVKNNLQVISSLLRMQSDSVTDPSAVAALKESQSRVLSMALIHERLYAGQQMDEIDFSEYARTLAQELVESYSLASRRTQLRFELERVLLKVDQAIPCGLILNELVTNALKYAYPESSDGEVRIRISQTGAGQATLQVADDGVGLPPDLHIDSMHSLGLPIVGILTKQLGGVLSVSGEGGSCFTICFPVSMAASAAA